MPILPKEVRNVIKERGHLRGGLLRNLPDEVTRKLERRYKGFTLAQSIYHEMGGKRVKCGECGKPDTPFHSFTQGYKPFCSMACSRANEGNKEAKRQTILKRYGGKHYMATPEVQAKFKATMVQRHGAAYTLQSKNLRSRVEATNLALYGAHTPAQMEHYQARRQANKQAINAKRKATMQERYGVDSAQQIREVHERTSHSGTQRKVFTVKGKTFSAQGHEPYVITELIVRKGFDPEEVLTTAAEGCKSVWYQYQGKKHRYHPDIVLTQPDGEEYIEVKSTYTLFGMDYDKVMVKLKAASRLGVTWLVVVCLRARKMVWIKNPHLLSRKQVQKRLVARGIRA